MNFEKNRDYDQIFSEKDKEFIREIEKKNVEELCTVLRSYNHDDKQERFSICVELSSRLNCLPEEESDGVMNIILDEPFQDGHTSQSEKVLQQKNREEIIKIFKEGLENFIFSKFHPEWSKHKHAKNIFLSDILYRCLTHRVLVLRDCEDYDDSQLLYNELLRYKLDICKIIIDKFNEDERECESIRIFFGNDHPCIMVSVKEFKNIERGNGLYKIIMTYFTAITNHIALKEGIPTELVIRASFGHNCPSVAETHNCFRINVGIISKVYAEKVLVESLREFDKKLPKLLNDKLELGSEVINRMNKEIISYNSKKKDNEESKEVEMWTNDDTVLELLCKNGNREKKQIY